MKLKYSFFILFAALTLTSCFKDYGDITFDEMRLIEFETAVMTAPSSGVIYPILSRTRLNGAQTFQVNLVGKQLEIPQTLTCSVDTAISKLLNANTIRAVAGLHYELPSTFEILADTSKTTVSLNILNPGANAGKTALLVLKLDGNNEIQPSENYRRIGIRINLN